MNETFLREAREIFDAIEKLPQEEQWKNLQEFFSALIHSMAGNSKIPFNRKFFLAMEKLSVPEELRPEMNAMKKALYLQKQAIPEDIKQALALIKKVFFEEEIPVSENYFLEKYPSSQVDRYLRVIVKKIFDISKDKFGNEYFSVSGFDDVSGNYVTVGGIKEKYLKNLIEENSLLGFINLKKGDNKNLYFVTDKSLITLEPDFLMDASSLGECFQIKNNHNPKIFFVNQMLPSEINEKMFQGKIVNELLDQALQGQNFEEDLGKILAEILSKFPLDAISLDEEAMENLKDEFTATDEEGNPENIHLQNLKEFIEEEVYDEEGKSFIIEPSAMSEKVGLQGRMDLLVKNENNELKITELKSGRSPKWSQWPNNKFQVLCYQLMLEHIFPNTVSTSQVLYSRVEDPNKSKLRPLNTSLNDAKTLLKVRNEIVHRIYRLAKGDTSLFEELVQSAPSDFPPFMEEKIEEVKKISNASRLAQSYYYALLSFVLREFIAAKTGHLTEERSYPFVEHGFASAWLDTLKIKKKNFNIIDKMNEPKIDAKENLLTFSFDPEEFPHAFREKDMVILYPKKEDESKPVETLVYRANIREIRQNEIDLSLYTRQQDYEFITKNPRWAIEPDLLDRNYWSTISQLIEIIPQEEQSQEMLQKLLGKKAPEFSKEEPSVAGNRLTQKQRALVQNALQAKDYFLLQGPPGTGKTSTFLVSYLQSAIKKEKEPIYVLAYTNKAVEQITKNLREPAQGKPIKYIRFGSKYTQDEFFFDKIIASPEHKYQLGNWKKLINDADVLVSTVSTFKNRYSRLKKLTKFSQVIIDEASQLTEADLAPILLQFRKFILIGDHNQLPAVILQKEEYSKVENSELNKSGIKDLRNSLFERLFTLAEKKGWKQAIGQLTEHYRMHEKIAEPLKEYYSKGLQAQLPAQKEEKSLHNIKIKNTPIGKHRLVFLDVRTPRSSSKANPREAKIVAQIVNKLVNSRKYSYEDIGIIVPFRGQIQEIRDRLDFPEKFDITIDTVERFQGDERKVILFSTVVSLKSSLPNIVNLRKTSTGKILDRKLLVSVSRAKEQLILVGNASVLKGNKKENQMYSELIEHISKEGLVLRI